MTRLDHPVAAPLDQTIPERIAWIEQVLKYQPPLLVPYRRQLERELHALTTDPEERYASR